jgi:hypothetical protein
VIGAWRLVPSGALRRVVAIALLASSAASGQSLEFLGPDGLVQPEGFQVAVTLRPEPGAAPRAPSPALRVQARGAQLRPSLGLPLAATFLVLPDPDARQVVLTAEDGTAGAERRFELGPPVSSVQLTLDPPRPVKGQHTEAVVTVMVAREDAGASAQLPPPVLRANVGTLEGLTRTGPGTFRARYLLPKTRYPEVAVLVAFAPWPHPDAIHGAAGSLLVPLATAIELPGTTEPNAVTSLEIAGVTYGPTTAGPDGRFRLPVVVPPGHRLGKATAVDKAGNRRTHPVDLMLPPTDQLACVLNPNRLPADGISRARLLCATSDRFGAPHKNARVVFKGGTGKLSSPRTVAPGVQEWIYSAPSQLREGGERLEAVWAQGRSSSREQLSVELVQGAAQRLEVTPRKGIVHLGGALLLTAQSKDGLGRPRDDVRLVLTAPLGQFSAARPTGRPGEQAIRWEAPAEGQPGGTEVRARAVGPLGSSPSRLVGWLREGELWVAVTDQAGWPVPEQRLWVEGTELSTGEFGAVRVGRPKGEQVRVRHAQWSGLRKTLYALGPDALWPEDDPPGSPEVAVAIELAPSTPVVVRIRVEGRRITYWAEDARGEPLPERELSVAAQGVVLGERTMVDGRSAVQLRGGAGSVSVSDLATGVTAVVEVRP